MFKADAGRARRMKYNRLGNSGLKVSIISLGLKHNFNKEEDFKNCREIVLTAFNNGINYFDLPGDMGDPQNIRTEELFGMILKEDLAPYRDEIIISTKIGGPSYSDAPMSEGGSRKLILSQIDHALARLRVPYVDILFHENFDTNTNPEETAQALAEVVRSGKALYIGLTNYSATAFETMYTYLAKYNVPFIGGQVKYSYLAREAEDDGIFDVAQKYGKGVMAYQVLAQGLLSNKYINQDLPPVCRATKDFIPTLTPDDVTEELRGTLTKLNIEAAKRNQSISQMAMAWALRKKQIATVVIGISKMAQLAEDIGFLKNFVLTNDEARRLEGTPVSGKGKK